MVAVGLGGNDGRTLEAFASARTTLELLLGPLRCSSLYRTAPLIDTDQPPFWNAVVSGVWNSSPWTLLERLQMLENRLGRRRDPARPKGPRTVDLDLLLFDSRRLEGARLTLPHPGLLVRQFVLEPLVEIAPGLRHPVHDLLLSEVLSGLAAQGVERCCESW